MTIDLPHGGRGARFNVATLIEHLRRSGLTHIVVGGQNVRLRDHRKPRSLDYWLRTQVARSPDTKQATRAVVDALVATGRLERRRDLPCPESGRRCLSLALRQ